MAFVVVRGMCWLCVVDTIRCRGGCSVLSCADEHGMHGTAFLTMLECLLVFLVGKERA